LKTDGGKVVLQTCGIHPELVPKKESFDRLVPEFSKVKFFSFLLNTVIFSAVVVSLLYGLIFRFDVLCKITDRLWSPIRYFYTRWPRISALIVLSGMVLAFLPGKSERALCPFVSRDRMEAKSATFLVRGSNFSGLEFNVPPELSKDKGEITLELYEKGGLEPIRKCTLPENKWKDLSSLRWKFFPVFESRDRVFHLKIASSSNSNIVLQEAPIAILKLIFNHTVVIGLLVFTALLTWLLEIFSKNREKEEKMPEHGPKRQFDYGMHYFRAFAIICIVFAHYFHSDLSFAIFNCSTIFFLIISGYLLIYLNRNSFHAISFYRKKFMNIILPYAIIATVVYLYQMRNIDVSSIFWYYKNLPQEVLLGYRICIQFWYIPFIAVVFLFTPILMKMPRTWLKNLTVVSIFVPLFAVRKDFLTSISNTLEVFVFFVPIYLIGMYYALEKEKIDAGLKKYFFHMIVIAVGLTLLLYFRDKSIPVNTTALYVQKLAIAGIAIVMLNRISNKKVKILDLFAKYSFSIYFLHVCFGESLIAFFSNYLSIIGIPEDKSYIVLISVVCALFTVLFICVLLKKITGRFSRNIFGG